MLDSSKRPEGRRTFGNRLLDALPAKEREWLASAMTRVPVRRNEIVTHPGQRIEFLHFPIDAFAWAWINSAEGKHAASVATVGHRGTVEWSRVMGCEFANVSATIVSGGEVWRLPVEEFEEQQPDLQSPLRRLLLRFADSTMLNLAYRLACNAEHNVDQRLARWLLWGADECGRLELALTHEQIAQISSIRRPSVSLVLSQFQQEGLLRSRHGQIDILDRKGLESRVCKCYWVITQNAEAVFA